MSLIVYLRYITLGLLIMAENEKPLSDYISSVEQVEVPVEGVEEEGKVAVKKEKSKLFPILVGILLFFIIGMGGYYVYKEYIKEKSPVVNEIQEPEEEKEYEFSNINKAQNDNYLEYGFSSKLPLFIMKKTVVGFLDKEVEEQYDIIWDWKSDREKGDPNFRALPGYLETISYKFIPEPAPGCGLGCAQEHLINIDVYSNTGSKSLEQVAEEYFNSLEDSITRANEDGADAEGEIERSTVNMWGQQVIKFSGFSITADSFDDGYLVVTPKFVYIINYFLSEEPAESFAEASNLMNSFKFGE